MAEPQTLWDYVEAADASEYFGLGSNEAPFR